jgi:hypothetical protein
MANKYDWAVIPNEATIKTVIPDTLHTYDLANLTVAEALIYHKRDWGINLGFGDPASSSNVKFHRQSGKTDPLQFGEMFAINIRSGRWLYYAQRDYGINLNWSEEPKYEWRFDSANGQSGAVPTLAQVGLYSSVEKDYLMYEVRDWGVNLKWYKDTGKYMKWQDLQKLAKTIKDVKEKIGEWVG